METMVDEENRQYGYRLHGVKACKLAHEKSTISRYHKSKWAMRKKK